MEAETKKCPYCAEEIQGEAIYCRWCDHYLDDDNHKGNGREILTNGRSKHIEDAIPSPVNVGLSDLLFSSSGRISRSTYLLASITLQFVVVLLYYIISLFIPEDSELLWIIGILMVVIFIIPQINIVIKRFHDLDKSGWYSLLAFVPLINIVFGWILILKEGTNGTNRFGD